MPAADMIRCLNCSAPLSGFKSGCAYCGTFNNVDRGLLMNTPSGGSAFACPACGGEMKNMELGKDGDGDNRLCADQCGKCFGLFFPFFKLDVALNDLARFGFLVDTGRLDELSRNSPAETKVTYRKCPVCSKLMNRINFGKRSGVITDQCHGHGVWLDSGELRRLVEWRNSGGKLVDEEFRRQSERDQEKRREREKAKIAKLKREARSGDGWDSDDSPGFF